MRWLILLLILVHSPAFAASLPGEPLPPFTSDDPKDWINAPPQSVDDLKGKVLLVDIWTFDCWNCYRSFPWLVGLEKTFEGEPFQVIGIHTPEFAHEKERPRVLAKTAEFGLHHPVMMDNDFAYWTALGNRYWPSFYLVDKQGRVRHRFIGETHAGDVRARQIETQIRELLNE